MLHRRTAIGPKKITRMLIREWVKNPLKRILGEVSEEFISLLFHFFPRDKFFTTGDFCMCLVEFDRPCENRVQLEKRP